MVKKEEKLIGIKAIAGYLDMSVRNVYHWEKKLGLPIHRVSGHAGYRLYAFTEEIDQWLKDKDVEVLKWAKRKKTVFPALISIFILVFVLVLYLLFLLPGDASGGPAIFSADGNIIYVKNSKGDVLWNFSSKAPVHEKDFGVIFDTGNIDDDAPNELIACTYDMQKRKFFITLFDHDGRILWNRSVTSQHTFNKTKYEDSFRSSPARFAKSTENEVFIISKWVHQPRFLSIIACHDREGNIVGQYHHTGYVSTSMEVIDLDGDGGDEIVFTGTNNLLDTEGIIGVLPLTFYGISPPYRVEPEYSDEAFRFKDYIADEMVRGNQLVYIRFKKTGLLPEHKLTIINTELSRFSDNIIQVELFPWVIELESGDKRVGFAYVFDIDFTLKEVIPQTPNIRFLLDLLKKEEPDINLKELLDIYSKIVFRWEDDRWVPVNSIVSD